MFLRLWLGVALAVAGVACGRVGVELVPLDASRTPPPFELDAGGREAGADAIDAAVLDSGGVLGDNVVVDAGTSRDAAAGAAQDAGNDAAQDAGSDAAQDAGADAAQDAGSDAAQDAGSDAAQDAGSDAAQDAGSDASADAAQDSGSDAAADAGVDAAQPPACGGERVSGVCWYLGEPSTSCNDTCENRGGFDPRSVQYAGTPDQGGSLEACEEIMTALGRPGPVVAAMRSDSYGFGCHVWTDGSTLYWLIDPPFRSNVSSPLRDPVRIVCGCVR